MPKLSHIICLSIDDSTLYVISEQLQTGGRTIPLGIVPETIGTKEFSCLASGATILVNGQKQELLKFSDENGCQIGPDQIIDFEGDPHFELIQRQSDLPPHLLLYQFANSVCLSSYSDEDTAHHEDGDAVLKSAEVAEFLGISERTVRELVANNKIPHKKVGGTLRFLKSAIIQWLKKG